MLDVFDGANLEAAVLCLAMHRADSIVRDCEVIRKLIVPNQDPEHGHDGRWSLLGQSFGGFCCATYLSMAPEGRAAWQAA